MSNKDPTIHLAGIAHAQLEALDALRRRRTLRPLISGSGIDLTHNDYMGLRADQAFQSRAWEAARDWPAGSGASRLLGGEQPIYELLEKDFAAWKGTESALYFPSGYAANEALMSALHLGDAVYFSDELNHASLIDGMRLARLQPHQKKVFPHNDMQTLEELLKQCPAALKVVVVEALYSMDGDLCPARKLIDLCQVYEAVLIVDEAHALGVYGPEGRGWMAAEQIDPKLYISVNPCGKAMAASGALICGPAWLRDLLINTARSFIYTTGASPWMAAALRESLWTLRQRDELRHQLLARVKRIRNSLLHLGFDCGLSETHIIPIILGAESLALFAEQYLSQQGVQARAIRPPTVAASSCRLRLSLHAGLSDTDEERICLVFKELAHEISRNIHHRLRN
jgi:8-amino-7-oxononanoate synthase